MAYVSVKRQPRRLAALLLAGTCLSPVGAAAQTWVGATGDYNTTSNWNPATVPTGSATTATFANTGVTSISLNNIGPLTIGTFQFDNNAQSYAFDVSGEAAASSTIRQFHRRSI